MSHHKKNTDSALKIFPIGGIEHVTQNMYLYIYGREIMIVDCGIGFPDLQMPGVDIVIPDISYLQELLDRGYQIAGMMLTHGHDDHIGALPYILPLLPDFPIYGSRLTAGFAMNRLLDVGNTKHVQAVPDREPVQIGQYFTVTPFAITHSVPDTKHFFITTPVGNIYHGSDFKFDDTPVDDIRSDFAFMDYIREQGVSLMLTDCLGVEKPERVASESSVGPVLQQCMADCKGKILVTLMSSHIHRIIQTMNAAAALGRKVALVGRSVEQNVTIAQELGLLTDEHHVLIDKKDIPHYHNDQVVAIIAGSQGQEGSSLVRAIYGEHREITLTPEDRVIFSADAIPGNELTYYGAVDQLSMNGIQTFYPAVTHGVHASGHARRPELTELVERIHPQKIFPIGGNNRHRAKYRELVAGPLGYAKDSVITPSEGDILALFPDGRLRQVANVALHPQVVDGLGIGDVGPVVLSDRRVLGQSGIIIVIIKHYRDQGQAGKTRINKYGYALHDMIIISRGFVFMKDADDVVEFIQQRAGELLMNYHTEKRDKCEREIERGLSRALYKIIQREPMIEVEIVDV